ncbi:DUF2975 domain-containing protein [Agrococcus citreus]|uniref:DUF2975 domain-containing protein n=1 Tax=Agrococcus citreus TaxID=84643 RepID=UPI0031D51E3D
MVLLAASVYAEAVVLPAEVAETVRVFPEVERLAVPGLVWGVLVVTTFQIAAIACLRLVVLSRTDRKLRASAYKWWRMVVACCGAFTALVVLASASLASMGYLTPGLLIPCVVAVGAVIAAVCLIASRLTRRPRA